MTMPGYKTKLEHIAIAGAGKLFIQSLLDRQQYYDPTGEALRRGICSASWPLFGLMWPSGVQLATQLAQRRVCPDERILEIGCGLGLASLVGQRRGAHITASDCHPLAEIFLDANAKLNDLPLLTYRYGQWGDSAPSADQYVEQHGPSGASMPAGLISASSLVGSIMDVASDAEPIVVDRAVPGAGFSERTLSGRYDLIIGSDLLYEPDMPVTLSAFIDRHANADAEVWIVDPNRGHRNAFSRNMAHFGFVLEEDKRLDDQPVLTEEGTQVYKGRLLRYRRQV
ncbi:class I SAM-dependent methyltransferase [Allopusillimonas ginsengisoli]|uniref:class I SAM-dependent methyltransferase n=1 Tax=Allopusillimonas ginsengisoli TaxID=453575 RepID=UPI0039C024A3